MKTKIIFISAAIFFISFIEASNHNQAKVEEQKGILIFAFSRPTDQYDILGTAKVKGIVSSENGPHMVELLVDNCKKNFPSADAIIVGSDFEKAEAIRFKP